MLARTSVDRAAARRARTAPSRGSSCSARRPARRPPASAAAPLEQRRGVRRRVGHGEDGAQRERRLGQRGRVAERLEQARPPRARCAPPPPVSPAMNRCRDEADEAQAERTAVAELREQRGGLCARRDRVGEPVRVVALPAVAGRAASRARARPSASRCGRTASRWASACRCDPARGRLAAAPGATARTVAASPASTAWCTSRDGSGAGPARSAPTTAAFSARRRRRRQARSRSRAGRARGGRRCRAAPPSPRRRASAAARRSTPSPSSAVARSSVDVRGHDRELLERRRAWPRRGARRARAPPRRPCRAPRRRARPAPRRRRTGCRR